MPDNRFAIPNFDSDGSRQLMPRSCNFGTGSYNAATATHRGTVAFYKAKCYVHIPVAGKAGYRREITGDIFLMNVKINEN